MAGAQSQTSNARFPKRFRVLKSADYQRIQREGHRYHTSSFTLLMLSSTQPNTRLGIIATKKIGNAVVRNRVKRRLREVFRQHRDYFPEGADIVVIAKARAADADYHDVESELQKLARVWRKKEQSA